MDANKSRLTDRRSFISLLSGILSGLLVTKPGGVQATKSDIKRLLANLETDLLETSRPSKHPSVTWEHYGDGIRLYVKQQDETRPFCTLNRVGKTIWEYCNGRNTPRDISELIHRKYIVSQPQAYTECLEFIAVLNTKGAIQL